MSEGLSRRRGHGSASVASSSPSGGGGGGSNNHNDGEEGLDGRRLSPKVRSASTMGMGMGAPGDAARRGSSHASGSGSGSASASGGPSSGTQATTGTGHKIAFDPQDLETRDEELEQPLLTLMEEIILLGIKECVKQTGACLGKDTRTPGPHAGKSCKLTVPCLLFSIRPSRSPRTPASRGRSKSVSRRVCDGNSLTSASRTVAHTLTHLLHTTGPPLVLERQHIVHSARMHRHGARPPRPHRSHSRSKQAEVPSCR